MTTELDQSPMHDRSPMMDLLQSSTVAGPDDAERLLPGLDEAIATAAASAQPPSGRHRRFAWGLGAVAAAAVVAFVLLPHGPPPAQPLERDLVQSGSGRDIVLLEGVNLRVEGSGSVGGTTRHPVLSWDQGALGVEVTPGAVEGLAVHTAEGTVHITGTAFSVTRDALGTHVDVHRGSVDVACTDQPAQALTEGDGTTCLPTTAGGLLGRAHALEDQDADTGLVVQTLEHAAARSPSGALAHEICLGRGLGLRKLKRIGEAQVVVAACLDGQAGGRQQDLMLLAVELAIQAEDCGAVGDHIEALGALGPPLRARCDAIGSP